jgi:methionyl-tRNA formyltransferase
MDQENRVVFLGSKGSGLGCLRKLYSLASAALAGIVTIDDGHDGRTALAGFQQFAAENRIELKVVATRKEAAAAILGFRPDLCMVMGWYWLLDEELLSSVARGFLGIHFSLLPKYRGGSPLVWQLINGEPKVGLSLFSFTAGMDEGDIWGQRSVAVGPSDYIGDVLVKLETESTSLIEDTYIEILRGNVRPSPQDHSQATYCAVREEGDGEIDWRQPARDVYNFIRAQSHPYPGAFTMLDGKKLRIWRARPCDVEYSGRAGQILQVRKDGVYVACENRSALVLETVQYAESEPQPAHEVLRSIKIRL